MACTHNETCEECHEANRRLKAEAAVKNELRKEIADILGVSHLRGETQLREAVKRLDQLILIEQIAIAAEKDGLTAAALEGAQQ